MRELPENAEMIVQEMTARRQQIEMRIEMHRDSAAGSLLEVGRWLNAAKDERIVPHGQWTAWVKEHAWMNERTAQKWMQAARELPEGSPLARLEITKIQSLMLLPAEEREEFAEQIGADKLSSREVDAAVKAARAERDEALRLVGEQKKKLLDAQKEKQSAVIDAISRTRADVSREKDDEIERVRAMGRDADKGRKQAEELLARAREQLSAVKRDAAQLQKDLEQAKLQKAGPDPETERKIALLESQIRSRDAAIAQRELEIDRLSEELDAAQTAAMRSGMTGGSEKPNPATTILSSIGALMAQAGRAPAELARLQGLDAEDKHILCGQARLVGQWAMQILAACGEGDADA